MKRNKKRLAIAAGCCIGAGVIIAGIGFVIGGRPGFYLNASGIHSYHSDEDNDGEKRLEKTSMDAFSSIQINIPNGDIHIIPSDGYYLEYHLDAQNGKVEYGVEDGVFSMDAQGAGGIIGFNFFTFGVFDEAEENYVNLYVPQDQFFESVSVDADMGDVYLGDIKAKNAELVLSMGNLDIDSFKGNNINAELDAGFLKATSIDSKSVVLQNDLGDILCQSLISEDAQLTLGAGDLELGDIRADVLSVENDMGDVTVDSLENKTQGNIVLSMGDFSSKYSVFSDLNVTSDLGEVEMCLAGNMDDYQMDLTSDLGAISVPDVDGTQTDSGSRLVSQNKDGDVLKVYTDCGNIFLTFK